MTTEHVPGPTIGWLATSSVGSSSFGVGEAPVVAEVASDGRRVGCDIVDVERFDGLLRRRPQARGRLFTASELADAVRDGVDADGLVAVRRLAARFAAKEALAKAWRQPQLQWTDVAVTVDAAGVPHVRVHGQDVVDGDVSLSHDGNVAMAVVIVPPEPPDARRDQPAPTT